MGEDEVRVVIDHGSTTIKVGLTSEGIILTTLCNNSLLADKPRVIPAVIGESPESMIPLSPSSFLNVKSKRETVWSHSQSTV